MKVNVSWQTWYPACSSTPWQIEGVVKKLRADGYIDLSATHNKTVVVDAYVGEKNNKQKYMVDKYGLRNVHLYEPEVQWVRYTPKAPMLVLDKIFPEGILIPEYFFDKNIIHLPTVKTHVFTVITGAMKMRLAVCSMRSGIGRTASSTRPWSISWRSSRRFTAACLP